MREHTIQDATGVIVRDAIRGIIFATGTTVPASTTPGYAPGCIFNHIDGTAGDVIYVNEGTNASCTFNAFLTTGDTVAALTVTALTAGTGSFSGNVTMGDGANIATNTGNGTIIGTAANQKVGLWGATAVIQPSGVTEAVGEAGLVSNAVSTNLYITNTSNFNGNSGNKSYTINAIVKALKAAGILAASG